MSDSAPLALPDDGRTAPWWLALGLAVAFYAGWHAFGWPAPVYLPESGTWALHPPDGVIGMRYYGWLLMAGVGFALGWLIGRLPPVSRRLESERGRRWLAPIVVVELLLALAYVAIAELSHWASLSG